MAPQIIALDTEALKTSGWPWPNGTFRELSARALESEIPLWIPKAVEEERRRQGFEDIRHAIRRFQTAVAEGQKMGFIEGQPPPANSDAASQRWETGHRGALEEFRITVVDHTKRPATEFFDAAIALTPPFAAKGVGFKDAMILAGLTDRMRADGLTRAWLVSSDSDFDGSSWLGEGLDIHRLSIREATSRLAQMALERLETRARRDAEHRRELVRQAVQESLAPLRQFLETTLKLGPNDVSVPGTLVSYFIDGIDGISAPFLTPTEDVAVGTMVEAAFNLTIQLQIQYHPYSGSTLPKLRPGEDYAEALQRDEVIRLLEGRIESQGPAWTEVELVIAVTCMLERTRDGYGAPRDFHTGGPLPPSLMALLRL